jgi:hypothetical protein
MSRTYSVIRFEQQEAIGAIRLVPVVLDNRRLAKQVPDDEGKERWASEMDDIRLSDFTNEIHRSLGLRITRYGNCESFIFPAGV